LLTGVRISLTNQENKMQQITTITFFRHEIFRDKAWGFKMIGAGHEYLKDIEGLSFYKLLGSGKGKGFNPFPDWGVYSLLQIWDSEKAANHFFETSELMSLYKNRTSEIWTLYLKNVVSKGEWSGKNPFEVNTDIDENNKLLCVITRATIKPKKLFRFWKYVPTAQMPIEKGTKVLIFTKGIGELPVIQMATFSIWTDFKALKSYAYESPEHKKAIHLTRKLDWYKEELFARFQPYRSIGTWNGVEPLVL
jgi:hypothetical protein